MPSPSRIWLQATADESRAAHLAEACDLPLPIARVLSTRGLETGDAVEAFLEPKLQRLSDPLQLPDMPKAVDRIWQAIQNEEPVLIFGDYDVDGVTSTAFLTRVLEGLGAKVRNFIPNRKDDGYGLSTEAMAHCLDTYTPGLIVTVDCGTGNVDAVAMAAERGVDTVVTDHHEASGDVAEALAVVNPKLGDDPEARRLAGVGVAFKLSHALIKVGRQRGYPASQHLDMRPLMYLVALGTVADMVPLLGENRILVKYGLDVLNRCPDPGIAALVRSAGIQQEMTSYHIGFVLGPRINAAGRIESPEIALNLLLSRSHRHAERLARSLEKANRERQGIEELIRLEAEETLAETFDPAVPAVMVVADEGWHAGVIGIVASRLVRRFHRPAIVISVAEDGIGRGSCRSIEGFDLIENLQAADDLLLQYGGHRMAAGLDIRAEDIDAFRERLNLRARETMGETDLRPRQHVDGWIKPGDLTEEFLNAQNQLMPFGNANPAPVWALRGVEIERMQRVGHDAKHLRLQIRSPHGLRDAIGFGFGERELPPGPVDLAFQLRRNVFRGQASLQLMLQDLRPSE